jgi:8-amino-7-oxononanoate synthase
VLSQQKQQVAPLDWMEQVLQQRQQDSLLRVAVPTKRLSPTLIEIDGKELVNFGANDYLGLSWNSGKLPTIIPSTTTGSGSAPLISGYSPHHSDLEAAIAEFEGSEAAIVFSTGYAANVGTISAIAQEGDLLLSDSLNHASLIDGCRLSKAKSIVYPHNDIDAIQAILRQHRVSFRRCYLATDTLFSMNGDLANLHEIARLAQDFEMTVIVDEAHATGVYGSNGRGWVEECGLEDSITVRIGTLSKSIGCVGGFVHGSQVLVDYLRNFARTYVYSTSMPESVAWNAAKNIQKLSKMNAERSQIRETSKGYRSRLSAHSLRVPAGGSPIIPIFLESSAKTISASHHLRELGFYVPAIRPPTVPDDQCMLRVSLSIHHTEEQLDKLIVGLVDAVK